VTSPDTKPGAAARCFGRIASVGSVLRSSTSIDQQCLLCLRRNLAIDDSTTTPLWWPGTKPVWTLPDVGRDGRCTRRLLPVFLKDGEAVA
jgi:hypothetical protein